MAKADEFFEFGLIFASDFQEKPQVSFLSAWAAIRIPQLG